MVLELLSHSGRQILRSLVLWMDHTAHFQVTTVIKGVLQSRLCCFACKAFAPMFTGQDPADLKARPTIGLHKANPPDQLTAGFLLHRPLTETIKLPVTDQKGQVTPAFQTIETACRSNRPSPAHQHTKPHRRLHAFLCHWRNNKRSVSNWAENIITPMLYENFKLYSIQ